MLEACRSMPTMWRAVEILRQSEVRSGKARIARFALRSGPLAALDAGGGMP
jgi:hypothetical protein